MSLPILCFDLDGTLLDASGKIHHSDIELLTAERPSALFIACSGRPLVSLRKTFEQNGLFASQKIPFPLVLQNGSLIFGKNEEFLAYFPFEVSLQNKLIKLAKEFSQITFLFLSKWETHILGVHPFGLELAQKFEFTPVLFEQASQKMAFSKLMCLSASAAALAAFSQTVSSLPVDATYSMPAIFEITPHNINKGQSVKRLLRLLKRDNDPFFAAGDGENDLSLLLLAAKSFAPLTAPEEIRKIADYPIDVKQRGLLTEMLFLGKK